MNTNISNELLQGDKINALESALIQNKISRRGFIKLAVALGVSMAAAKLTAKSLGDAAITQLYNAKNLKDSYDYIVVGSGSAGAVVASRLAEESNASVLVLEAGGTDQVDAVINPLMWGSNIMSERDWKYMAQPSKHVNGRSLILPMGKVVGGGSSINASIWARGHENDFNFWADETGDDAWGYENVLSIYRRIENWQGEADSNRRGKGGRLWVTPAKNPNPIAPAMLKAAAATAGIPTYSDTNGAMMEGKGGAALTNLRIKDGRRQSIASDYLYGALKKPNITLLTGATVLNLELKGTTVSGLVFEKEGKKHTVNANKRVILSAGAINTPRILMQSGIGRSQDLEKVGIKPVHDLQGVGQNFQDHVLAGGCIWEYKKPLPPQYSGAEAALFWKSNSALDTPDLQPTQAEFPYASEVTGKDYKVPPGSWSIAVGLVRPLSTGEIKLTSSDPQAPLNIDGGFLKESADVDALVRGIELSRELGNSAEMSEFAKKEVMPGPLNKADMVNFARNATGTYFHQSCTCKMGKDSMSVVDNKLSVYGIENLSIADASVMPRISTGNTMAPTVIIGERMADILLGKTEKSFFDFFS